MRHDLKTIKVYFWNIEDKKLRTVAIELETFSDQKNFFIDVFEENINNVDYPILLVSISGKIQLFSMLSGQLLKDISEDPNCLKVRSYNFLNVLALDTSFIGMTRKSII